MSAATEATDAGAPSAALEAGLAMVALLVALLVGYGWSIGFHVDNVHNGLIAASFSAVGLYVVRMRPRHREGWLFVTVGVVHAVMFFGRQYGRADVVLPAASWIGWLGVWPLPLAIALTGWSFMAFPHGHMLSPAWRRAAVGMVAVAVVMATMSALWPVDHHRIGLVASHPLGLPGAEMAARAWPFLLPSYALFQVLWTTAVVVRLLRARGDEARQMRWLVYATVMAMVLLVAGLAVFRSPVPGALAVPLIPVAAGIAIMKHRLYDIDPVVNKTLVIACLALVVTGGYIAIVVGVGALIPVGTGWLSLLTTAIVAVAFEPLRRRAQSLADRLVYGHRATPYEACPSSPHSWTMHPRICSTGSPPRSRTRSARPRWWSGSVRSPASSPREDGPVLPSRASRRGWANCTPAPTAMSDRWSTGAPCVEPSRFGNRPARRSPRPRTGC